MDMTNPVGAQLTRELARHVSALRYEALPVTCIRAAKQFMLDTLAVAWAGSDAPGCAESRAVLLEEAGSGESTAWGWGDRLPASAAAFLNGVSSAALDYDSLGRDAPTHVNVVILPAALAMAERQHATGKEFVTALVAGCDVMCRLGAASEATGVRHKGWVYTSVHGVFGAAAAAARLLKLDTEQTLCAFGLAYSQAGGTQQFIAEPGLAKRLASAFAARAGVFSALLAQKGITAPKAAIEGAYGVFRMYQEGSAERLLRDLGKNFENENLSIKKFPSCGCNHAALEGTLRLTEAHDLRPEDVESVDVEISEYMNRLVGGPFDPSENPQAAAQFNIRYSIACAITRRKFGLGELATDVVRDPEIRALSERVNVIVDPDHTGKRGPVNLRIHSRRHGSLVQRIEHVPGTKESPLSDQEIESKCRECFSLGVKPLDATQVDRMIQNVMNVERGDDMSKFFAPVLA